MRAISFQQSQLKAFVQSPCFARNNVQGMKIYCGAKQWRGLFRWPHFFGDTIAEPNAPIGNVVYLGIQASLIPAQTTDGTVLFHGATTKYGDPAPGPWDFLFNEFGIKDDGSIPYPVTDFADSFLPVNFPGKDGGLRNQTIPTVETKGTTVNDFDFYTQLFGPYQDPSEALLETYHWVLSSPFTRADLVADAIAVARNDSIKPGQGSTGCYHEESGGNDIAPLFSFARSSFAFGTAFWQAGWSVQTIDLGSPVPKPWDGHQHHVSYKQVDATDIYNNDGTKLGAGNLHKAYLVSSITNIRDVEFPNRLRVMCSTFSGSGALATYENPPLPPGRPNFGTRISCIDIVADNLKLDPVLPTLPNAVSRWQIFFPGKAAKDIPLPSAFWDA